MAQIIVQIEVLNSAELIKNKRGKFFHWVASRFNSEEDFTRIIEKKISEELVSTLKENLDLRFKKEGISANLRIRVHG